MHLAFLTWMMVLAPLFGGLLAGFGYRYLGRLGVQVMTISSIAVSFGIAVCLAWKVYVENIAWRAEGFAWYIGGELGLTTGLWIDHLSIMMMTVISFVSLLVHIYSVAYLRDDEGYRRFFSYLSLFTFAMLILIGADNFLQLFFGWEAVGLCSYLLIGFWFEQPVASNSSFKVFLVNRVADFGFLLGIALLLAYTGSLQFTVILKMIPELCDISIHLLGTEYSILTIACILLFIGAMGKSAQIPLHVWLPESMVAPTPVSALIHAATMVTAGIYMTVRLSALFEQAPGARALILATGTLTALLMGLVAIVQTDIKRIIAFSTLSQLGYMVAALGASGYIAATFHLVTHAFFKALLFLSAGSVILALHHEQDIRKMGGSLWKRLPITYSCFWVGALSLIAIPPFSGFYSKDAILEAIYETAIHSQSTIAFLAFYGLLMSVLITAIYTFRLLFLVFHGQPQGALHHYSELNKPSLGITLPLVLLAMPSIGIGKLLMDNILIKTPSSMPSLGWITTIIGLIGIVGTWGFLAVGQAFQIWVGSRLSGIHTLLSREYGFDTLNQLWIEKVRCLAKYCAFWDREVIDRWVTQETARVMQYLAKGLRRLQSGYLYHYLLIMIMGMVGLLLRVLLRA